MGKRLLSLCMALALCLGLLPVTALAEGTAPQTLYVGSTTISAGYWKSSDGGTTWARQENQPEGNNYIYYDGQGTLKLHNATIQGGSTTESAPFGSGIYALSSSNQPVTLTIELIGENTITGTFGIYVNAEMSNESYGTDASLTITGQGSLDVSGSSHGIWVKSGSGNASLTIENASVVANTTPQYYHGVVVQSSTFSQSSPALSLAVNGGSLTASGTGNSDGILFHVGQSQATGATTSLTITDHAIVDARNGGISASRISETLPTPTPTGNNSSGIVFDDKNGTVYGSVALQDDLTIGAGETLTVPSGSSLNCNGKLTNNGTILASGGTVTGSLSGSTAVTTPNITVQPSDNTVTEGEDATFTVEASAGSETPTYQWQQSTDSGSNWTNIESATSASYTTDATTTSMSGYQYRCVVKSASGVGVISAPATLTVTQPVTGVTLDQTELSLYTGESKPLTATVEPDNATNQNVTWTSSNTSVATVNTNGNVTAVGAGTATITVTTAGGSHTATCTVTVEKPYTPPPYIPPTYAVTVPETTGGTVEVSPSRASSGRRVTITTQPAPGYELESLTVLDSRGSEIALTDQGNGKYTFTMPARKVMVQASFAPVPLPFEDVSPGAWYEEAVRYAYFHNIMEGTSATTFVPNKSLTRAEAVQVLYNLEDQPTVSESTTFPDLVHEWYKPAIAWAEQTGVVDGYEDGTFRPDEPVTREEFAQMLYNYAAYKGYDLTAEGDLAQFPDGNQLQEWARPAMTWANGNELINGHDDGTLEPGGTTTRAQAAAILMRFDQNLVEN